MSRAVCFDLTHLVSRLGIAAPSGIDQVDLAFGRYYSARSKGPFVHYGLNRPHMLSAPVARAIVKEATSASWRQDDVAQDQAYHRVRAKIIGPTDFAGPGHSNAQPRRISIISQVALSAHMRRWRLRSTSDGSPLPEGAIYLNAAQHLFEYPRFFKWMDRRPDIRAVFLIHDLLPFDYPEYFRPGYKARFARRMETAFNYGRALVVTSQAVRTRVMEEYARRRQRPVPIIVVPLPSSHARLPPEALSDAALARVPYFVTVGTIEPRKNHLLLLNIWRQLAERGDAGGGIVPKLVVVGGRGWENEQVLDILDRSTTIRPHVIEISGLSTAGLSRLIANARALLMPSFAEGYGLPMVEALDLGTPVVATDAPVFREVTQGCATYRSALDGSGWSRTIQELVDVDSTKSRKVRSQAQRFVAPTWDTYFDELTAGLASAFESQI